MWGFRFFWTFGRRILGWSINTYYNLNLMIFFFFFNRACQNLFVFFCQELYMVNWVHIAQQVYLIFNFYQLRCKACSLLSEKASSCSCTATNNVGPYKPFPSCPGHWCGGLQLGLLSRHSVWSFSPPYMTSHYWIVGYANNSVSMDEAVLAFPRLIWWCNLGLPWALHRQSRYKVLSDDFSYLFIKWQETGAVGWRGTAVRGGGRVIDEACFVLCMLWGTHRAKSCLTFLK